MSGWLATSAWADGLPDAALFGLWLRLGWGMVLGGLVFHVLRRMRRWFATAAWPLGLGLAMSVATIAAPGGWSAAHWLGLAFWAPSGLLVGLCVGSVVVALRQGKTTPERRLALRLMGTPVAATLVVAGVLLYSAHLAWIPLDLYAWGQHSPDTLWLALAFAVVTLLWAASGHWPAAWALALALLLHAACSLPTGNLWDAMLDPWLWAWAVAALLGKTPSLFTMRAKT